MPRHPLCGSTNPAFISTRGPTGWRDEADRVRPLKIPRTRKPPGLELLGNGILLAQRGGIALPAKKKIAELFLYDADMDRKLQSKIAKGRYNISNPEHILGIKTWKALAERILSYKTIDHLVLSFHAYSGGMLIGSNAKDLDQKSVKRLFFKESGVVPTRISKISIDGCNIAENPSRMTAFARWFGSQEISGYTWSIAVQQAWIEIPKGSDEASIRKDLSAYRKFIVSTLPDAAALAKRCRTTKIKESFIISYGTEDGSTATFPLKTRQEKTIKPLSSAIERAINSSEVNNLQKEYDSAVIQAFEHVTITFH